MSLTFTVRGARAPLRLWSYRVVVAGYTGRDEAAVRAHIKELERLGVPPPDSVPAFYDMPASLLTQAHDVTVSGPATSGEVEPVLVRASGQLHLGVGSDHTDRHLERTSVAAAKASCPKLVSSTVVPMSGDAEEFFATVSLRSEVDGQPYQEGMAGELRTPTEVMGRYLAQHGDDGHDIVMFCGTIPILTGEFRFGDAWRMTLGLAGEPAIVMEYAVTVGDQ